MVNLLREYIRETLKLEIFGFGKKSTKGPTKEVINQESGAFIRFGGSGETQGREDPSAESFDLVKKLNLNLSPNGALKSYDF